MTSEPIESIRRLTAVIVEEHKRTILDPNLSWDLLRSPESFAYEIDFWRHLLERELRRREETTEYYQHPLTWWDAFKVRFFVWGWLFRIFARPRYRQVPVRINQFTRVRQCPHVNVAGMGAHLSWLAVGDNLPRGGWVELAHRAMRDEHRVNGGNSYFHFAKWLERKGYVPTGGAA